MQSGVMILHFLVSSLADRRWYDTELHRGRNGRP